MTPQPPLLFVRPNLGFWVESQWDGYASATLQAFQEGCFVGTWFGGGGNGITFSPDYKKVYIVSRQLPWVFDVGPDNKISNQKQFSDLMVDGVRCATDGIRVDIYGNLWCSSNAGANLGYSGVTVWSPEGKLLGRIRLPETTANLTFGGAKRNRLFMTSGQSLYALYVNTQGAAPG